MRQAIQLDAAHGQPVLLDSCGDVLAVATSGSYVRMYKLAGRELKQNCGPGQGPACMRVALITAIAFSWQQLSMLLARI